MNSAIKTDQKKTAAMKKSIVKKEVSVSPELNSFDDIKNVIFSFDLPRQNALELCVAAEEIFVNICTYAFEGKDKQKESVRFCMTCGDRVTLTFSDHGIPFDPRQEITGPEVYDMETRIGGLGRLIAFTIADSVNYMYRDGNILTIAKTIREEAYHDDHQN